MRSRVLRLRPTTIAHVASGTAKAADLEPGGKPGVWDWTGSSVCGRVGGRVRSNLLRQFLRSADLWRYRHVRFQPAAKPAPAARPGAASVPGRCAGAPGIGKCLPPAVRAAGGSGAGNRRRGRGLHVALTHLLPAVCPSSSAPSGLKE